MHSFPMAPARTSNRRLLLFLAAALVPPVVLVFGPFRANFFLRRARQIQWRARPDLVVPDPARVFAQLHGPAPSAGLPEELAHAIADAFAERRYADAANALERVPIELSVAAVRELHGVAELLAGHPALATAGLEDALKSDDAALVDTSRFALAQALFSLSRGDDARRELEKLSERANAWQALALEQLSYRWE